MVWFGVRRAFLLLAFSSVVACSGGEEGSSSGGNTTPGGPTDKLLVSTTGGQVQGATEGAVDVWRGVPYAAPPVGPLRLQAPQPAPSWTTPIDATDDPKPCVQFDYGTKAATGREDCLYVNVWAPHERKEPLPVVVWLHGGGHVSGSGVDYAANELAPRANAIVVTVSFRLGALGWLVHPSVGKGNLGLADQIASLRWVQANIAAFGGDAARVVVAGQESGADDVCALVASREARGLFSRAMAMSGACRVTDAKTAASTADAVLAKLGCTTGDVAACLRGKPAEDFAKVPGASDEPTTALVEYSAVVDGALLPDSPEKILERGEHQHVPFVLGSTKDEYVELVGQVVATVPTTPEGYDATLKDLFGAEASKVSAVYPLSKYPTPARALAAIYGDSEVNCPARRVARALAKTQSEPILRYVYALPGANADLGAPQGLDVGSLFRDFGDAAPRPDQLAASDALADYLGRFAKSGDVEGAPRAWPGWRGGEAYLVVDTAISDAKGYRDAECDLLDGFR